LQGASRGPLLPSFQCPWPLHLDYGSALGSFGLEAPSRAQTASLRGPRCGHSQGLSQGHSRKGTREMVKNGGTSARSAPRPLVCTPRSGALCGPVNVWVSQPHGVQAPPRFGSKVRLRMPRTGPIKAREARRLFLMEISVWGGPGSERGGASRARTPARGTLPAPRKALTQLVDQPGCVARGLAKGPCAVY